MRPSAIRFFLVLAALLCGASRPPLAAQITPGSVSLGVEAGPAIYIGEFNSLEPDNSFHLILGIDGIVDLRYHLDERWSIGALIGVQRLNFQVDSAIRAKYASNFFGPPGTATFPSSTVAFTEGYQIAITQYGLFGEFRPIPSGRTMPFLTAGLEGWAFQVYNDSGVSLPEDLTGPVDHRSLSIAVGGGVEYTFNAWLSGLVRANFYLPLTDYLDGYAHYISFETNRGIPGPGSAPTLDDHALSIRLGLSALIHRPSPRPPEEPPPAPPAGPSAMNAPPSGASTPPGTGASEPPASTPARSPNTDNGTPPASPRADTAITAAPTTPVDATPNVPTPTPPPQQKPAPTPDDTDGDGLRDVDETGRYMTDPRRRDTDGDNVNDRDELFRFNTSPNNPDTDGDGLLDGQEVYVYKTNPLVRDTDHDGLTDGEEVLKYVTDPLKADSDGDGLYDRTEIERGTNPLNRDTDNDGVDDRNDACPTSFGPPANGGCPDQ